MIKCIVVDDEKEHREFLRNTLTKHFPDIELVGEADSVLSGIQLINNEVFDILFLDIQMQPYTGFDLLKSVTRRDFQVIFTTAYDQYAIEAIRFSALDYLLKPYSPAGLKNAIERFNERVNPTVNSSKIDNLFHNIDPENKKKRIGLSDKKSITFYDIDEIVYCEAENVYTTFYFDKKEEVVMSKSLIEFERELINFPFFRIHSKYLINMNKVVKYIRGEGGEVIMSNGKTLDVSRNKKQDFIQKLNER